MAKHKYTIASDEGAAQYGHEVGEKVTLDLSVDEQRAVVAAGWVEQHDVEKPKDKPDK